MKRAAVAIVLLTANVAAADELRATREQPLSEVSHSVEISIANGVATYKVRRQFANPGTVADEAGLAIDLPAGAAATGLRIRAKDRWYDGELMEREAAAKLYQEMTGLGAHQPKDPALLQWQWADKLYLQVFPIMPGAVSTVEYTLTVPTRFANGRYWLSYPRVNASLSATDGTDGGTRPLALPTITVKPAWGDAQTLVIVDGQRVAPDTAVVLAPPTHQPWETAVTVEPGASYVASTMEIPASPKTTPAVKTVSLMFDIAHTYQSDLDVELVTPQGQSVPLLLREGGGDNVKRVTKTIDLPTGTTPAGTWRIVASDHAALDTGSIDAWSLTFAGQPAFTAADTPVFIPDAPESASDAGVAAIAVEPPAIKDSWLVRYGRVIASTTHAFGRLEVDVAPQLSTIPKRAQVVFVVDASYSVGQARLDAQLAILDAYLAHVPDAVVEVIAVRRHAARVFNDFIPAGDVHARLAANPIALGNGSALDEGAALSAQILATRSGTRRLVLLSDEMLRSSLSQATTLASLARLPADTIVHVVVPTVNDGAAASLARDDSAALSPLATKHKGILARVELGAFDLKPLVPVALELVRPTRIDNLAVTGATVDVTVLREGDGIRLFTRGDTVAGTVKLRGDLWSTPVTKTVEPVPAFSRATAAFLFGADEQQELSPEEMMRVALMGRAVSPVTSYVAAEPGTRPSTIGFGQIGTGRYGTVGHGSGYGGGYGSARHAPDFAALVDPTACVAQHHPADGWHVRIDAETTRDEIVDLSTPDTSAFAACLVETAWSIRLDDSFDLDREAFVADVHAR